MKTDKDLRKRTWISFVVFFAGFGVFAAALIWLRTQPTDGGVPAPFRKVLELNGQIWKTLSRPTQLNRTQAPPAGTEPRVNGDIGLKDDIDIGQWKMDVFDKDDPNAERLQIHLEDIRKLPRSESSALFKCIEGWSQPISYAGVKFRDFVEFYRLKPKKYVALETPDGRYYVSIDLDSMMHEQTMLAYEMNGAPLSPENGAPLRLIIPVKYGIKHLKRIGRIYFSDTRPPDYWAERGYDWFASL